MKAAVVIEESLKNLNIASLNDMQKKAIDAIYKNRNTLIHAPTGSGKTLAYLLPISKILVNTKLSVQAMIIVPSRELALQIKDVHRSMRTPVTMMCCYGGHSNEVEKDGFKNTPSILVGTPGRIAAHMRNNRFDFSEISILVLDEFDKCLEFGFLEEMQFIVENLKKLKKRICISATQLDHFPEFVRMDDACRIEFQDEDIQPQITFKSVISPSADKLETLVKLIKYIGNQSTLIFCNHRDAVERVVQNLKAQKIDVLMYHGGMEQDEREKSLIKFSNGSYHLLVTTDLASRGLNIPEIQYIIHYHLPTTESSFIHRNGRTARMHATGTTYLILSSEEQLPDYIAVKPEIETVTGDLPLPEKTEWVTLEINAGKRDKINKVDIVGFLFQKGHLQKDDLGIVNVTEKESFAAVKRSKSQRLLALVANETLKRKQVKITVGR
jgi:ATP-independent RNA helicase DbpA